MLQRVGMELGVATGSHPPPVPRSAGDPVYSKKPSLHARHVYGAIVKFWSLASLPTAVLLLNSSTFALHVPLGEFGTVQL